MEQTVRLNIKIPASLHRKFKSTCARNGETQTNVVLRFMHEYIAENQEEQEK